MEATKTACRTFTLDQVVNYDNQKVVFNQLMKTPLGGVNLLAMKQGQKLDTHTAPGAVLVYILNGQVTFNLPDGPTTISQGQALIMEAGTPHSVQALQDSKIMLVKIDN